MFRTCNILGISTVLALAASAHAQTIFTDRDDWELSVASVMTEDFNSEPNVSNYDTFDLPYTTDLGVTIDELGNSAAAQFLATGNINGSQAPHIRDFGSMITWTPGSQFDAFGFDWNTAIEPWEVIVNGTTLTTLPSNSEGFLGVTFDDATQLSSFTLTGSAGAQGGISVDDLSFANVPAPGPLSLVGIACACAVRRRR